MLLALVLTNGLLAGAEIAIVASRLPRLTQLAEEGRRSAKAALRLRDDPESFLATVQVGITVVSATAGAFGGAAFAEDLAAPLAGLPGIGDYAAEIAFVLVVCLLSYVTVVLGELVPKSLALRESERYALLAARPLLLLSRIARPVVWLLGSSSNLVLRLFDDSTSFTETRVSAEELRQLVEDAARHGEVHPAVGDITLRALGFADLDAEDVMVHRRFVVSVPSDASVEEARERMVTAGHERAPVLDPVSGDAVGFITLRDLVQVRDPDAQPLAAIVQAPLYVPESMSAVELLRALQRRREPLAVVVDERGGTVGIVTLKDLVEELIGEMLGWRARSEGGRIEVQPDGTALVDGIVPVHAVNRRLRTALPELDDANVMGGLCSKLAGGRLPQPGEELEADDGTRLVPVEVSPRRVRLVRVHPESRG